MRHKTHYTWMLALLLLAGACGNASAKLRITLRPWRGRAIITVPPVVVPVPAPRPVKMSAPVGYVDANVYPRDAEVFVDGQLKGKVHQFSGAPDYLVLSHGKHRVSLRKVGYGTETFIIDVAVQRVIRLDVTLERLRPKAPVTEKTYELNLEGTGSLVLDVEPADATLYIDGVFYGACSEFSEEEGAIVLREGAHNVQIVRPGYETHTDVLKIHSGRDVEINAKLRKVEGDR